MSHRAAGMLMMLLAASACNQRAGTLDTPVAPSTTSLTPPSIPGAPPPTAPQGPVQPGQLATLNLTYSYINAGDSQRGVVNVHRGAPPEGLTVSLSVNNRSVIVPATVVVPPGEVSAEFTVTTLPVMDQQSIITASAGGRTAIATLTLFGELPVYYTYTSEPDEFFTEFPSVNRHSSCCADFSVTCKANEVRVDIEGPGPEPWSLTFKTPDGAPLHAGAYEGVSPAIRAVDKACQNRSGSFVVREIDIRNDRVNRFRLSFEHRCLDSELPGLLRGEIRLTDLSCRR